MIESAVPPMTTSVLIRFMRFEPVVKTDAAH